MKQIVQNLVVLHKIVLPNVVVNGVIAVQERVLFEFAGVLIGEDKIHSGAALNRFEDHIVGVAFLVERRTGKLNVSVQNRSQERNRAARFGITAGINIGIDNVIYIRPRVGVARIHHQRILLGDFLQCLLGEFLAILAVVGVFFIKVGVQCVSKRGNRNALQLIIVQIL